MKLIIHVYTMLYILYVWNILFLSRTSFFNQRMGKHKRQIYCPCLHSKTEEVIEPNHSESLDKNNLTLADMIDTSRYCRAVCLQITSTALCYIKRRRYLWYHVSYQQLPVMNINSSSKMSQRSALRRNVTSAIYIVTLWRYLKSSCQWLY